MIYMPNKKAIRYKGDGEYVFREEQSRERPVLQNGDIVICSTYAASLLTRRRQNDFEYVDINEELGGDIVVSTASDAKDEDNSADDTIKKKKG